MKVLKFGGTSVGSSERIRNIVPIIQNSGRVIVVLSAMAGATDRLSDIAKSLHKGDRAKAEVDIQRLEKIYRINLEDLFAADYSGVEFERLLINHIKKIRRFFCVSFGDLHEKELLAQGEIFMVSILSSYLKLQSIAAEEISALKFMRIDKDLEPDEFYIRENLVRELQYYPDNTIFITEGFICRNAQGAVDNLQRGGSDYTASLLGAALHVEEVQIWTDIDGFHNNDPRYVAGTRAIKQLSFDEAAELAYFGAKIMHPSSILPCKLEEIPVLLKNSMRPDDVGTVITNNLEIDGVKSIAAKDGITVIRIRSGRMLLAYGFLRKVFEVFEQHKISIDMITTSEVAVSITIDDDSGLDGLVQDLKGYGDVEVEKNQTIVCIVGDFILKTTENARMVLEALCDFNVRMIACGGSSHNISVLVQEDEKSAVLQALSRYFFS